MSALLGRIPSAVGYQPTLATDMGALQERITTTTKGSITSVQAIYVPADDLTDPAPGHLLRPPRRHDRAVALDRREGHLPGGRSARLDLAHARPADRRRGALRGRPPGAADPAALQGAAGHHRHPGHGRAVGRGQDDGRPRPQDRALPVAALLRRRSVHRLARQARRRSKTPSRASRAWSKASTTTCRRPPSTWSAPSRRRSRRPSAWPPKPRNPPFEGIRRRADGHVPVRTRLAGEAADLGRGRAGRRSRHRGRLRAC